MVALRNESPNLNFYNGNDCLLFLIYPMENISCTFRETTSTIIRKKKSIAGKLVKLQTSKGCHKAFNNLQLPHPTASCKGSQK